MKSSNRKKKYFSTLFCLIVQFTRERIKPPKRFWHHSMCFQNMHIVSKFQFYIHISMVVKLKNKIQNFKKGGKKGKKSPFLQLFQWIDEIKASFLDQNNASTDEAFTRSIRICSWTESRLIKQTHRAHSLCPR